MAIKVERGDAVTDYPMFIDGAPAESDSGDWIEVRSPATGELVGRAPAGNDRDVDRAVAAIHAARTRTEACASTAAVRSLSTP